MLQANACLEFAASVPRLLANVKSTSLEVVPSTFTAVIIGLFFLCLVTLLSFNKV